MSPNHAIDESSSLGTSVCDLPNLLGRNAGTLRRRSESHHGAFRTIHRRSWSAGCPRGRLPVGVAERAGMQTTATAKSVSPAVALVTLRVLRRSPGTSSSATCRSARASSPSGCPPTPSTTAQHFPANRDPLLRVRLTVGRRQPRTQVIVPAQLLLHQPALPSSEAPSHPTPAH